MKTRALPFAATRLRHAIEAETEIAIAAALAADENTVHAAMRAAFDHATELKAILLETTRR